VSNLAASLGRAGRPAEAATLAAEVLPTLKEALGDDHPWVTATMQTLGAARYDAGDIEGSVSALRDALAGYEKIGSPQPTTAEVRDLLARSLRALQRDPEAD
jgi:hypothetical protein